jgi:hypothetical protein
MSMASTVVEEGLTSFSIRSLNSVYCDTNMLSEKPVGVLQGTHITHTSPVKCLYVVLHTPDQFLANVHSSHCI